jgi:hypothetical protein
MDHGLAFSAAPRLRLCCPLLAIFHFHDTPRPPMLPASRLPRHRLTALSLISGNKPFLCLRQIGQHVHQHRRRAGRLPRSRKPDIQRRARRAEHLRERVARDVEARHNSEEFFAGAELLIFMFLFHFTNVAAKSGEIKCGINQLLGDIHA